MGYLIYLGDSEKDIKIIYLVIVMTALMVFEMELLSYLYRRKDRQEEDGKA